MDKRNVIRYGQEVKTMKPTKKGSSEEGEPSASAVAPAYLHQEDKSNCFCFESDDDSTEKMRMKYTKKKLARGCLSNMTICLVLVGYTFLGAVLFLAIEGGSGLYGGQRGGRPNVAGVRAPAHANQTPPHLAPPQLRLDGLAEESRLKAVENIWEITVSLNILYKENWTRLAAQEIARFQESIVKEVSERLAYRPATTDELRGHADVHWTLAKAFLYSLTVLTTVGYGNLAPKTGLGKAVTMGYAALGIPLVLLYLSSVGSLLSSCARNIFTRSLCCCLCSNCGYCCYDEKRMQEKERRMRKKREKRESERLRNAVGGGQEPFFLGPGADYRAAGAPPEEARSASLLEPECLSADTSLVDSKSGNFLAPLLLCLVVMVLYIGGGAFVLCRLEPSWTFLDSVFFCFMVLSTIGFGDSVPADSALSGKRGYASPGGEVAVWFCSWYILCGLALTAMCFSVVHEEIVHRLKHHYFLVTAGSKRNSFKADDTTPDTNEYLSLS